MWDSQLADAASHAGLRAPVDLARVAPFELAGLRIDPARKCIAAADGREEIVEPRVMQVLVALTRADGAALSRDDLIASCWGGTHVGDDAVQRAVAMLRRTITAVGEGRIAVETLPKIGYRLVATPRADPPAGEAALARVVLSAWPSRWTILLACALVVALAGGATWWLSRRPAAGAPVALRIDPFRQIGAVAPMTATQLDAQLHATFNDASAVIVRTDSPDYVLGGTIAPNAPDGIRYTATLQTADGTTLWSSSFPEPPTPRGQLRMAQTIGLVVRCGLGGSVSYPKTLPPQALSLLFDLCRGGTYPRQIDLGRRLTTLAPDFAVGWAHFASAYATATFMATPGEAAGYKAQASAAARRAIAIDPRIGAPYRILAELLPVDAPLPRREALLHRSVAGMSDCGCEHVSYQYFLTAVGRIGTAVGEAQRAADMEPGVYVLSQARVLYFAGEPAQAVNLLATYGPDHGIKADWARVDAAIYRRDWAAAARIQAAQARDASDRVIATAFAALASQDPTRIAAAADAIERAARAQANGEYQQHTAGLEDQPGLLLAAMGRPQGAFDAIAAMIRTNGPEGMEMLFDPIMAPYRADARYTALVNASGLMAYWRATHTRPDFCAAGDAPAWCRTLA